MNVILIETIIMNYLNKETKLKLGYNYNGINDKTNSYYEISGKSYKTVKSKIDKFNKKYSCNVYCYDDTIKDVTNIIL